jgi:hypothetical protein
MQEQPFPPRPLILSFFESGPVPRFPRVRLSQVDKLSPFSAAALEEGLCAFFFCIFCVILFFHFLKNTCF